MMVREAPQFDCPLRAPREDRGRLIEPPLGDVEELLQGNENLRAAAAEYDLQGRPLKDVARRARQDLLNAALAYTRQYRDAGIPDNDRVILAGHQAELFHPGVWYKNFVLDYLAREHRAAAVNLVIDSDVVKQAGIRVPGSDLQSPTLGFVDYDDAAPSIPLEKRRIGNRELWASFGRRTCEQLRPFVPDPLLKAYWPLVLARARETANLGECLSQARHQWEGRYGLTTLELPQSQVCESPAFLWFVAHCLAQLPRLWNIHNDALADHRRRHKLRSASHPVPDLAAEGSWLEAPFWLWTTTDPRRRAVFVRQAGDELELSDRGEVRLRLALHEDANAARAVEQLAAARDRGIKLRTRALTTTLWARLALGDLFVHGIGGAKYDLLTDEIWRRFLGAPPPAFLAVSATLRLPVPRPGVREEDVRRIDSQLRELRYHPEFHLNAAASDAASHLAAEKQRWIAAPQTPANARARYLALRRLNAEVQPFVETTRLKLLSERARLALELRAERVLGSREYAFCLYPEGTLRDFMLEIPADKR